MMDTNAIDNILRQNKAFQIISNARDIQELSSETNESLESDQDIYSENVTKINTLSSSIDFSLQSSQNQTNRIEHQIQFEEFELDESLNNENAENTLTVSQVSVMSKEKDRISFRSDDFKKEKLSFQIEEKLKDSNFNKQQGHTNSNQKGFIKKNIVVEQDGYHEQMHQREGESLDLLSENVQLKKEIENLNLTLKQQEKENFYLHQNIKTLKEELYESKGHAQKVQPNQDIFRQNSNQSQNNHNHSQDGSASLQNSDEKNHNKKLNLIEGNVQINVLNEQMGILRDEMDTMKEMYLAKLKEQTFLVDTLTKKLGEKDEFIQKMKVSYINSLNQSKNSQLIQSQIYGGNSINLSQNPQLLQESCISELSKPNSVHQSMLSQQQQPSLSSNNQQQPFNNTFDQVKLSQEFEQLRRDIKFSTMGNISPFLRDEKGVGREDLLSTASNLQPCANNSSSNSNYCNQSTNNYSKTYIQQSPFNQSKYHNLSHLSNLSNRGFSSEFNPNTSLNGNIVQQNVSQNNQQNQGSSGNITAIMNQTAGNYNNSITTHMTSTSANTNNTNTTHPHNTNNSTHNRSRGEQQPTNININQKRNSSFTNSSANASHNLNQSINQPSNSTSQNVNNSILQFTPVSHKHTTNQSNNSANHSVHQQQQQQQQLPQNQVNQLVSQSGQTQIQQNQKQQQITLDFRLTFNQNEIFNATQTQQQQFTVLSSQDSQQNGANNNNISNNIANTSNNLYSTDIENKGQPLMYTNNKGISTTNSSVSSHQKQNSLPPQIFSSNNSSSNSNNNNTQSTNNNNNVQRGQQTQQTNYIQNTLFDHENLSTDSKQKVNSKEASLYNSSKYGKQNSIENEKLKDISNPNYSNNLTSYSAKTSKEQPGNSTNKSLKEQLMHQQVLQQKKQQILQNQQQSAYQNLIVKNNNQDLIKNLKKQAPLNQNQQTYSGISPKKQQSKSYHVSSSTQPQNSTNKIQQNNPSTQQQQQQFYLQELAPSLNYNQTVGQNSTKSRKSYVSSSNGQGNSNLQGISYSINNVQDTIPGSTMSVHSNFSNNLPIFRSINNPNNNNESQQNHNLSCNSNNSGNQNNNSFKFLNKNASIQPQQNGNASSQIQSQIEKKRFLQTAQVFSQNGGNKISSMASPSKYSNSNSEQKQLFLRTQQIYPSSQNNNNIGGQSSNYSHNHNQNQSSSLRQKSLAIPQSQQVQNSGQNNLPQSGVLKVPASAGSSRKNNSLSINNAVNPNSNLITNNFNTTTVHSTTSTQSGGIAANGGLQEIFKFNQNEKQKKLNDFFSKTLQVKPGELKSLNENLGCFSNTKNAARLIQQMEFSSFDDVEIQLDDLQILSNQIKEVLQNDPLKKNAEERNYKNSISQSTNNPLRQSGIGSQVSSSNNAPQQSYQQPTNNNRSQSENHNYQNLQQQFQLHQQLNGCLFGGAQTVNVQPQNNNKKVLMKSFDNTQQLQSCIDEATQMQQLLAINSNSHTCTNNSRVRPPKNNNFIFNENNKVMSQSSQNGNGTQIPINSVTSTTASQHTKTAAATGGNSYLINGNSNINNNSSTKNSNYKSHRKHLTLLNTDDISSKNQGNNNYPQSEISTQKAAFSDIHRHQLY